MNPLRKVWKWGGELLSAVRTIQQEGLLVKAISRGDVGRETWHHLVPDAQTLVFFPLRWTHSSDAFHQGDASLGKPDNGNPLFHTSTLLKISISARFREDAGSTETKINPQIEKKGDHDTIRWIIWECLSITLLAALLKTLKTYISS